ncbi:MAG TPA: hypothetical protein VG013_28070 [Gemmataceae bacterium]|nr:hypothetical protein [Gemmataceae bacterium]
MWSLILGLTTVLGFALAIWQAMGVEQLNKRERDLDWPRFRNAAADLARSVDRSGFMPDGLSIPGFLALCGTKATAFLPEGLRDLKDKRVLLLDDFVMSGDGLLRVKNQLLEYGFAADGIRSGSVVATKVSIANKKGPDSLPGRQGISISSSRGGAPSKLLTGRSTDRDQLGRLFASWNMAAALRFLGILPEGRRVPGPNSAAGIPSGGNATAAAPAAADQTAKAKTVVCRGSLRTAFGKIYGNIPDA